jgi:two-component system, cell cycle response regulator CpdR
MTNLEKKVMVVDDENMILYMVKRVLSNENLIGQKLEIESYSNPLDALVAIEKSSYDLVISDLMMPEMSGVEFIDRSKKFSSSKVIFMSGYFPPSLQPKIEEYSQAFLDKPFQIPDLVKAVKYCLE